MATAELLADGLMRVSEAVKILQLSRSTLYSMMEKKELEFVRIGRSRRIPRKAVDALMKRNLVERSDA